MLFLQVHDVECTMVLYVHTARPAYTGVYIFAQTDYWLTRSRTNERRTTLLSKLTYPKLLYRGLSWLNISTYCLFWPDKSEVKFYLIPLFTSALEQGPQNETRRKVYKSA